MDLVASCPSLFRVGILPPMLLHIRAPIARCLAMRTALLRVHGSPPSFVRTIRMPCAALAMWASFLACTPLAF